MTQFINMQLETPYEGEIGIIQSSFGTSGKFKVHFPAGTTVKEGDALYLRFKRYVNDTENKMRQNDHTLPKLREGTRILETPKTTTTKGGNANNKKDRRKKNNNNNNNTNNTNNKKQESKTKVNNDNVKTVGEIASYKGDANIDMCNASL